MKHKIALFLALLLLGTAVLTACGGDPADPAPEGMQVCFSGNGYTFYAPEGWDVTMAGGVPTASVSAVNGTNLTCVRIETDKTAAAYFAEGEAELTARLSDYTLLPAEGSDTATLGGTSAIRRTYTATVGGKPYKFMQLLCQKDGYLYLLTYTAENDTKDGKTSLFDTHLEEATAAIAAFAFEGTEKPPVTTAPPTVIDGMFEASDPAISRYSLYAPLSWEKDLSTGITTVKKGNEAAVSLSYEVPEVDNIPDLWEARKQAYAAMYEDFAVIEAECEADPVEKLEDVTVFLGEVPAVRYVYTFTVNGTAYKAAEIVTIKGVYIYTLTYTAKADCYASHMEDFEAMQEHFVFHR